MKSRSIGIILMALLAACAGAPATPPASTKPAKVKVSNQNFASFGPIWLAYELGYFKEQNLDVELVDITAQADVFAAILGGQIDVATNTVTAGIFNSLARGTEVRVVADRGSISTTGCSAYGVALRKGDFSSATPTASELRGKAIHFQGDRWQDYFASRWLATFGLTADDLKVQYVANPSRVEALNSGQIQVVPDTEPYLTQHIANGHLLSPVNAGSVLPGSQTTLLTYGPNLMGANADVGKRFMVAYLKGVRKFNEGKTDETVKVMNKYLKMDEALLKKMCWSTMRNDGVVNVDSMMEFQQWALDKKLVDKPVTREQLFDPAFVQYAAKVLDGK
jgi:NitT/TauT family transport system substrate-binding protein